MTAAARDESLDRFSSQAGREVCSAQQHPTQGRAAGTYSRLAVGRKGRAGEGRGRAVWRFNGGVGHGSRSAVSMFSSSGLMRQRVALAREKLLPILGLAQIGGDRGGPQDREGATRAEGRR